MKFLVLGTLFAKRSSLVLCALVLAGFSASLAVRAASPALDYVEGEALVRFTPSQTLPHAKQIAAQHGGTMARHFGWLSAHEGQVIGLLRSSNLTTAALVARLRADPGVAFAEPNYLRYPTDLRVPNDPKFSSLYSLRNTGQAVNGVTGTTNVDISFLKAWGLARPATNEIVVGVIDSGLDLTHPDITNSLWTNFSEIAGNGLDDDGNGYVDDVHGFDFVLHTGAVVDSGDHGTHVAGTIAATGNNGNGIIGVDFQARLMALKVSTNGVNFTTAAIIEAIQYATMMKNNGVNVVALNASYGGGSFSGTERSAMQAAGNAGIVFCAAAGNNTNNNDATPFYPASYRLANEIVVAATDQNDALASFSDYGATTVDLAAPGVNILSCLPLSLTGHNTSVLRGTNTFPANQITYGGETTTNGITAAIYYCGLGNPADFPAAVSNNIALIQRGTLTFAVKVANAMLAGARAAVIFNNTNGNFLGTLGSPGNWIPAVSLSQLDGLTIQSNLPATGTVLSVPDPTQIYQFLDGTSMAAPHVSGAIAFAAMNFPSESVSQRIKRILTNATPVAALSGKTVTGARLNLARIVDTDGNGLPDWWEQQFFGHLTTTDPNADPDGDGANNLVEFLAGTSPTNAASAFPLPAVTNFGGNLFTIQWPSIAGRYYRLLRSTNLLTGFDAVVQSNLLATPPLNTINDSPPTNAVGVFYRLQLEP